MERREERNRERERELIEVKGREMRERGEGERDGRER